MRFRPKCQMMERRNSVAPEADYVEDEPQHEQIEREGSSQGERPDGETRDHELTPTMPSPMPVEASRPRIVISGNVDKIIQQLVDRMEAKIEQKHPEVQFSAEVIIDAERRESIKKESLLKKEFVVEVDEPSSTRRFVSCTKIAASTSNMDAMHVNASFASKTSGKSVDKSTNTSLCEKCSIVSVVCRICYDETVDEPVISPCNCKGTIGLVHKSCLERWLAESNTDKCDLCHKQFTTERKTKYTVGKSLCVWLRYRSSQFAFPIRDLKGDIISCSVLSPIALGLIYICLLSADYYNQTEFAMVPAAQWTSLSVMMMGLIMLIGFFVWIYLVIRYHSRVWYFWWQRETIVEVYLKPKTETPALTMRS